MKFRLLDASGSLVTDAGVIDGLYKVADSSLRAGSTVDVPVSSDSRKGRAFLVCSRCRSLH